MAIRVERKKGFFLIENFFKMNRLGVVWYEYPHPEAAGLIVEERVDDLEWCILVQAAVEQAGFKPSLTPNGHKIWTSEKIK